MWDAASVTIPPTSEPRPAPPTGTVTFLFTDIEASTRLLTVLGDRYHDVLDLHDDILRGVWARHDGYEFNTGGDAFYVAFGSADDAVRAAADAQRSIESTAWPEGGRIRIRIGVHTGFAQLRRGDYAALAVNQTARVIGAAHGGQVLVSQDTREHLTDTTTETLRGLGRFRVRDFDAPVELFAVEADGWTEPDRPPRVQPADGHNLVRPLTPLIGREEDRAWLQANLGPGRVTTVVGGGGVGKTRLATEVALDVCSGWRDGVWFVDLEAVRTSDQLANRVASAVGTPQTPGVPPLEDVQSYLRERNVLLVLDNCEHVVTDAGRSVHDILVACPRVGVLATSRVPLGLRAETTYRLQPLLADGDDSPAVQLFLDRAAYVTDVDRATVRELCRELDGVPLALELAAARSSVAPPALILEGLHRSTRELRSDDPTLPDRHRSLERVLEWSWELLDERARVVLRRLAVFAGSFDLRLAGVAAADETIADADVPAFLWTLLDHSFVAQDRTAGATRFRLPVPVRLFAAARSDPGETQGAVSRLGHHYRDLIGPEHAQGRVWSGRMDLELDNLRGVIRDLARSDVELAQTLAWSVGHHHRLRGAYVTGAEETTDHLRLLAAPTPARVGLLNKLADLLLDMAEVARAEAALDEAEALAATVGPPSWDRVSLPTERGGIALRRGDPQMAMELGRAALGDARTARDRARCWSIIGMASVAEGDLVGAVEAYSRELEAVTEGGLEAHLSTSHGNLAEVYLRLGDRVAAAHHQRACLELARANGETVPTAFSIIVAGALLIAEGSLERGVTLYHAGAESLDRAGLVLWEADATSTEDMLDHVRTQLDEGSFAQAVEEGRRMPIASAADEAARVLASIEGSPAASERLLRGR